MGQRETLIWQWLAAMTIGLGIWYLHWRWTDSLNPDALVYSIVIALAETLALAGSILFFYDIWEEGDTPQKRPPGTARHVGIDRDGPVRVDVFITTFDEDLDLVAPSIQDAKAVIAPDNVDVEVFLLDDGNRADMRNLADRMEVTYLSRATNEGFKAGNIRNALFHTDGDFIVICDADTRLFPGFLQNTLGYFRDAKVAWVQTPHWFYDIPAGERLADRLAAPFGRWAPALRRPISWITGEARSGQDPYLSDPALFFDVIQRRRNRHSASFCCGAGSIHRREAIFFSALKSLGRYISQTKRAMKWDEKTQAAGRLVEFQPFRFHVSEDILTSIDQHSDRDAGWRSVFHPHVESRMLSPWSMKAWATQRLKYAGGTLDIILNANPIFRKGMPWKTKLHYAATFWSYLSVLWMPLLLMAPVFSLFTGIAPVEAYSFEFFAHLLPLLLINELAMAVGCKGYDKSAGTMMWLSTLPIQIRAFSQVVLGRRPKFPPTPKTPVIGASLRQVFPNVVALGIMAAAATYGIAAHLLRSADHTRGFLLVNLFWLAWNALGIGRIVMAVAWSPTKELARAAPAHPVKTPGIPKGQFAHAQN